MTLTPELRGKLVEAYLGHRLNNHELVDLLRQAETESSSVTDTFTAYSQPGTDWRGEVSPQQVDEALQNLGLREQFENLDETRVWSAEDRAVYRRLSQLSHDPPTEPPDSPPTRLNLDLVSRVSAAFSTWDRDGNIRLEKRELDYLMSGGAFGEKRELADNPEVAGVLATLMRHHDLLGSANPHDGTGISLGDLALWNTAKAGQEAGAIGAVNASYEESLTRARSIEPGQGIETEAISGENIFQGVVGSCVLLSTIIGTEPQDLRKMLTDQADGSFKVTFADGASEIVADPTLAERLHHSQGANGDRWPAIFELAAAQRLLGEGKRTEDGLRGAIEGIDPEFALPAFTGRPADKRSIDELTLAQTRDLLEFATSAGGPLICGSRPTAKGNFINVEELHNGIANGHCYAIKHFDKSKDTLMLQNPWHKGEWKFARDGCDEGVFEMPIKDFYASFRWVAFAQTGPQPPDASLPNNQ